MYFNLLPFKACKAVNQILCILNLLILITVIVFFFRKDKETRQEGNDKLLFLYENNYVKQLFKTKNFRGDCYDPTSIRLLKKKKCLYNLNISNKKNKAICNHVRLVTRI